MTESAKINDKLLQEEINRREEERTEKLRHKFEGFLEPRTPDIEEDEANLLKAYELFCKVNELCEAAAVESRGEKGKARLRTMEISSPLCRRDDYTLGEDMAFLRLWFLQKEPEAAFIPEFIRAENGQFYLDFTARELWAPGTLEKEILQSLEEPDGNS